jgi:hypothetical protein
MFSEISHTETSKYGNELRTDIKDEYADDSRPVKHGSRT